MREVDAKVPAMLFAQRSIPDWRRFVVAFCADRARRTTEVVVAAMPATASSLVISGRDRQVRVMW